MIETRCDIGYYNLGVGSDDCTICESGRFCSPTESIGTCPTGSYSLPGKWAAVGFSEQKILRNLENGLFSEAHIFDQ